MGVNLKRFYVGYSYDHYFGNEIMPHTAGTHEITIGMNFNVTYTALERVLNRGRNFKEKEAKKPRNTRIRRKQRKSTLVF